MTLTQTKTKIADGLATEALLESGKNPGLGDSLQLIMQCWLKDANIKHTITQRGWGGMSANEITYDGIPRSDDLRFAQALFQAKLLHERGHKFGASPAAA
jgi:hypothetical protein